MASHFNAATDLPDLTGKVVLITGATSGLGYPVAQELLRKGATVYLAARNESKAIATISRLEREGLAPGHGKPLWHKLDLENPHDVKNSAEEFLSRESRLDILSTLGKEYGMGPIGVQDIVTVNYISPFLFTKSVLPLMRKTAQQVDTDVRIVIVASDAHKVISNVQFKTKSDLNGPSTSDRYWYQFVRYAYTKVLDILWMKELARQLAVSEDGGTNILCLGTHPGAVASEGAYAGVARLPWPLSVLGRVILRWFFRTSADAAATVLIPAAKTELRREKEKYHGRYLVPIGKLSGVSKAADNEVLAKELHALTENILSEEGL
ncbi:NAD-binding protein [Fomitiporia mediterranea MF3/22]|uniref:NAD-binding protein n=1 Tax=Fomitiporia mediterranea (strain MF3/22) TaxID=694068 RepID=UPI00044076A7|nr:NAD-binding protein [Fomitiporia mediterranea MF3/22]EJD07068.1 NAD-binding protein [Fomitiporia mediterranea MF3/22]